MKKIILITLYLPFVGFAADFVSPITFDGSDEQKQQVIAYIEERVEEQIKSFGDESSHSMRQMLEEQSLKSFKALTQTTDKELLQAVIKRNCSGGIDLCDYTVIEMLYQQDLKAKNKKLEW